MASISRECSPLLAGMLSSAVIVLVRVSLHSIQEVCKKLAWSMFYRNLDQPELDKIQTIKELLCVKYGLLSLPSLDVSKIDFMLESLCIF